MVTKNLLVELLVEELPPKALKKLGEAFAEVLSVGLVQLGLVDRNELGGVQAFASPRRLAVFVPKVQSQADEQMVSHKLMPVSVGLNADGQATPALLKKLAALGADASAVPKLQRRMDGKAEVLFLYSVVRGASLAEGLQKALDDALAKLPIPKVMQYQLADGWTSVHFVRPAHGLVALHGADVVPVKALGLEARRETLGHRFEAPMTPVVLQDADHYARQLEEQGAVIASFAARHGEIARQLQAAARKEGLTPIEDAALLDEVTALVERPNVLLCRFDEEFLGVPPECLILTMKANQKYFPLLDAQGKLTHKFLVVSNIRPQDASRVIEGNERVVRPRLADAKFFFDKDRKTRLEDRVPGLDKVVYHAKLGTMGERVERVRAIAREIGRQLGGEALATQADEAAKLAKADLLTDMVGEFPELQGTMGRYYAKHDGLSDDVAFAIEDHYKPRFAGDSLPRNKAGLVVALADKMETLARFFFNLGQPPTGDKDPFALRRSALGVLRILIEGELALSVNQLIGIAERTLPNQAAVLDELHAFFYERLEGMLRDQGFSANEVGSVLALKPDRLTELRARLLALGPFMALPEGAKLAEANKRIANILKKAGFARLEGLPPARLDRQVDDNLLQQQAERTFRAVLNSFGERSLDLVKQGKFGESLLSLVPLSVPVAGFFDEVMVNVDDENVRTNRITLLRHARAYMNQVADLSQMAS